MSLSLRLFALPVLLAAAAARADFVWLEAEKLSTIPKGATIEGVEHSELLSGRQWIHVSADPGEVAAKIPAEGVTLSYPFSIQSGGDHAVWARIGFEFARSPFAWRVDDGAWTTVKPDDLTTDLMELSLWTEAGWLKLGDIKIATGAHRLEFVIKRAANEKGEFQRTLFALDAAVVTSEGFVPNGPYKPDDKWRTDEDHQAGDKVFEVAKPVQPAQRVVVPLNGLWEVCRADEQLPGEVAKPIMDMPTKPIWHAIQVPGDKNQIPSLVLAHRLWYRTRFNVPADQIGRSFSLTFPANNLNTTVFVNGTYIGFDKNPFAQILMDVTKAVKPGVNELWVGIRDAWYGRRADPKDPMVLRRTFNTPLSFFTSGWQELVYPIWNQPQSGILGTPTLTSTGSTYASDVFCIPSVAKKSLGLEVTLENPGAKSASGELWFEAVNADTGQAELTGKPVPFELAPRANQVLKIDQEWPHPKLWWPDSPQMYNLRTTVKVAGRATDVKETPFGFREWTREGIDMKLNGVRWQGFSEGIPVDSPEQAAEIIKKRNLGFIRMWPKGGDYHFYGEEPTAVFDKFDKLGVLVRYTGYADGEVIGYLPNVFPEFGQNWIDHLKAWIKGYRNHPSIFIWSIENEMTFINARNVGALDTWEPIINRAWTEIQKVDPTRPVMPDGGSATRANTLPISGDHYTTKPFWNYPQLAYEANAFQDPWTWDLKRPRFIGEELFAAGINPAYAYFGGENTFLGKVESRPSVGKAMQVISEGYRWFGVSACDFCQSPTDADGSYYNGYSPRAVLVRQWDWTFASGQRAKRTFGIFNGTRFDDPITFTWALRLGNKQIDLGNEIHKVAPGGEEKFDRELPIPAVTTRQEGQLVLRLLVGGSQVFKSIKDITILPAPTFAKPTGLFVYDPEGTTSAFLTGHGVSFTALKTLAPPPVPGKIWLVGKDALMPRDVSTTELSDYALGGGRVLVLEQKNPLRYGGLSPAEAEFDANVGRTAFLEDATHPILAGLKDKDFFTWEPGEIVYRNAYFKPSRGAKSLLQCNESLTNSALLSIPIGKGVVTLCQAVVTEKLGSNVTARTLMANLLAFTADYKLEQVPVAAAVEPTLGKVLDAINLQYAKVASPLDALSKGRVAVVSATPANLKLLVANEAKLRSFTAGGGELILHGLTPDGLADYNKLVGFEHMIRPFRRERVAMAMPKSRLLSGVTLGDLVLYSSQPIFSWQSGNYVASDTFSYVVDTTDVAPFGAWDNDFHLNLVNGMTSADGWPYIVDEPNTIRDYTFTLPKPQTIAEVVWTGNALYNTTTKIALLVDDKQIGTYTVKPGSEPTILSIEPPVKGLKITLRHVEFTDLPDKNHIIGCDNIEVRTRQTEEARRKVRPLLNVGGLVEYPEGKGGIILCNLLFKDQEDVPTNAIKKRTALASILRNLKAPFAGKTLIAGTHLEYTPVDISKQATQYRTDRGWFGDKAFTFKDIPTGVQTFAGVKYNVYEMPTSPVPTVVMLGGDGIPNDPPSEVKGIPVGRTADALFFLHTARIDQPRNRDEIRDHRQLELAKYIVHYADGKIAEVPLNLERDIDSYLQKDPRSLAGAQIAWIHKYDNSEFWATAYSMQWTNPRPDVIIASIDLVYGKDRRGVPALLAVTAAVAKK